MGKKDWTPEVDRDLELEEDCPNLVSKPYRLKSEIDPAYNCVAFALGDTENFWYDAKIRGYYWPPGAPSADTMEGWLHVFQVHGYTETRDYGLEAEYEKIAIYALDGQVPEHVARQTASGLWVSKMGRRYDIEHETLAAIEGPVLGRVAVIMKRLCKDGKRVLE